MRKAWYGVVTFSFDIKIMLSDTSIRRSMCSASIVSDPVALIKSNFSRIQWGHMPSSRSQRDYFTTLTAANSDTREWMDSLVVGHTAV